MTPGAVRVGLITARVAILVDHYHLTLREVAALTDRQIRDVYFHARTKEGSIDVPVPAVEAPDEPPSLDATLRDLGFLKAAGLITAENYGACVAAAEGRFRGGD